MLFTSSGRPVATVISTRRHIVHHEPHYSTSTTAYKFAQLEAESGSESSSESGEVHREGPITYCPVNISNITNPNAYYPSSPPSSWASPPCTSTSTGYTYSYSSETSTRESRAESYVDTFIKKYAHAQAVSYGGHIYPRWLPYYGSPIIENVSPSSTFIEWIERREADEIYLHEAEPTPSEHRLLVKYGYESPYSMNIANRALKQLKRQHMKIVEKDINTVRNYMNMITCLYKEGKITASQYRKLMKIYSTYLKILENPLSSNVLVTIPDKYIPKCLWKKEALTKVIVEQAGQLYKYVLEGKLNWKALSEYYEKLNNIKENLDISLNDWYNSIIESADEMFEKNYQKFEKWYRKMRRLYKTNPNKYGLTINIAASNMLMKTDLFKLYGPYAPQVINALTKLINETSKYYAQYIKGLQMGEAVGKGLKTITSLIPQPVSKLVSGLAGLGYSILTAVAGLVKPLGSSLPVPTTPTEEKGYVKGLEEELGGEVKSFASGAALGHGLYMGTIGIIPLLAQYVPIPQVSEWGREATETASLVEQVASKSPYAPYLETAGMLLPAIADIVSLAGIGTAKLGAALLERGIESGAALSRIGLSMVKLGEELRPLSYLDIVGTAVAKGVEKAVPLIGKIALREVEIPVESAETPEVAIKRIPNIYNPERTEAWQIEIRGVSPQEVENELKKAGIVNVKITYNPEEDVTVIRLPGTERPQVVETGGEVKIKIGSKEVEIPKTRIRFEQYETESGHVVEIRGRARIARTPETQITVRETEEGTQIVIPRESTWSVEAIPEGSKLRIVVRYPRQVLPRRVQAFVNRCIRTAREVLDRVFNRIRNALHLDIRYDIEVKIEPLGNGEYMVRLEYKPYVITRGMAKVFSEETPLPIATFVVDEHGNVELVPVHPFAGRVRPSGEIAELYARLGGKELKTIAYVTPSGEIVPSSSLLASASRRGTVGEVLEMYSPEITENVMKDLLESPEMKYATAITAPIEKPSIIPETEFERGINISENEESMKITVSTGKEKTAVTSTPHGEVVYTFEIAETGVEPLRLRRYMREFTERELPRLEEAGMPKSDIVRSYLDYLASRGVISREQVQPILDVVMRTAEKYNIASTEELLELANSAVEEVRGTYRPVHETYILSRKEYVKYYKVTGGGTEGLPKLPYVKPRKAETIASHVFGTYRPVLETEHIAVQTIEAPADTEALVLTLEEYGVPSTVAEQVVTEVARDNAITFLTEELERASGKYSLKMPIQYVVDKAGELIGKGTLDVASIAKLLEEAGLPRDVATRLAERAVRLARQLPANTVRRMIYILDRYGTELNELCELLARELGLPVDEVKQVLYRELLLEAATGARIDIVAILDRAITDLYEEGRISEELLFKLTGRIGNVPDKNISSLTRELIDKAGETELSRRQPPALLYAEIYRNYLEKYLREIEKVLTEHGIHITLNELDGLMYRAFLEAYWRGGTLGDALREFQRMLEREIIARLGREVVQHVYREVDVLEKLEDVLRGVERQLSNIYLRSIGEDVDKIVRYISDVYGIDLIRYMIQLGLNRGEIEYILRDALYRTLIERGDRATLLDFVKNLLRELESTTYRVPLSEYLPRVVPYRERSGTVVLKYVYEGRELGEVRPLPLTRLVERQIEHKEDIALIVVEKTLRVPEQEAEKILNTPLIELVDKYGKDRVEDIVRKFLNRMLYSRDVTDRALVETVGEVLKNRELMSRTTLRELLDEAEARARSIAVEKTRQTLQLMIRTTKITDNIEDMYTEAIKWIEKNVETGEDLDREVRVLEYEGLISREDAENIMNSLRKEGLEAAKRRLVQTLRDNMKHVEAVARDISKYWNTPLKDIPPSELTTFKRALKIYLESTGLPPDIADQVIEEIEKTSRDLTLRDALLESLSEEVWKRETLRWEWARRYYIEPILRRVSEEEAKIRQIVPPTETTTARAAVLEVERREVEEGLRNIVKETLEENPDIARELNMLGIPSEVLARTLAEDLSSIALSPLTAFVDVVEILRRSITGVLNMREIEKLRKIAGTHAETRRLLELEHDILRKFRNLLERELDARLENLLTHLEKSFRELLKNIKTRIPTLGREHLVETLTSALRSLSSEKAREEITRLSSKFLEDAFLGNREKALQDLKELARRLITKYGSVGLAYLLEILELSGLAEVLYSLWEEAGRPTQPEELGELFSKAIATWLEKKFIYLIGKHGGTITGTPSPEITKKIRKLVHIARRGTELQVPELGKMHEREIRIGIEQGFKQWQTVEQFQRPETNIRTVETTTIEVEKPEIGKIEITVPKIGQGEMPRLGTILPPLTAGVPTTESVIPPPPLELLFEQMPEAFWPVLRSFVMWLLGMPSGYRNVWQYEVVIL